MRVAILVLAITLGVAPAAAHVTPSVDDNNRYLKLTPLGDRVRIAYTVAFGDNPGQIERKQLDTDHDGTISEDEAHAFGAKLAAQVAAAIDLDIDGKGQTIAWTDVDVGMGSPTVTAGAFSIDLVAYPCLATTRGAHTLLLHDRFRISHPGRTEVKIEDSPGVTVERGRIGGADVLEGDYASAGPGGPLQDDGLDLRFTVGDKAPVTADGKCTGETPGSSSHTGLVIGLALAGVAIAAAAIVLVGRRAKTK